MDISSLNKLLKNFEIKNDKVEVSDTIFNFLSSHIKSKKRLIHSLSVASLCFEVALSNKLENPLIYYAIGLFHDIAKDMDKDEEYFLMEKYYRVYEDLPEFSYHQFLAEFVLMKELNIFNKEILDAVKFHCTGKANMDSYQKIVFACDKIDPTRGYDSKYMIDAMKKDYASGFKLVLHENMIYLEKKTSKTDISILNRLTKECTEYYLN